MIARMSKVEIAGQKGMLQEVLSLLRELSVFQVDPAFVGFIEKGGEEHVRSFVLDEKTVLERMLLEELRLKIDEFFS